jgi:hypothetical protein
MDVLALWSDEWILTARGFRVSMNDRAVATTFS